MTAGRRALKDWGVGLGSCAFSARSTHWQNAPVPLCLRPAARFARHFLLALTLMVVAGLAPQSAAAKISTGMTLSPVSPISLGQTTYTGSIVFGSDGNPPDGQVQYYVCGPFLDKAGCASDSRPIGGPVDFHRLIQNQSWSTSPNFTPTAVGWYCFAGRYLGSATYDGSRDGGQANSSFCVRVIDDVAPTVTLSSVPAISMMSGAWSEKRLAL